MYKGYIYGLKDPRDNMIKYVGQSWRVEERFTEHLRDGSKISKTTNKKSIWIRELYKLNLQPILEILEEFEFEGNYRNRRKNQFSLDESEIYWIEKLNPSKNMTKGGNGDGPAPLSNKEYIKKLKLANPLIVSIEPYNGVNIRIKHKCLKCNHIWNPHPREILGGNGCPKCDLKNRSYPVVGRSPKGSIIKFPSIREAGSNIGTDSSNISRCCVRFCKNGKRLQTKGWQFMYLKDYENGKKFDKESRSCYNRFGPIVNIQTGKYFHSMVDVEKQSDESGWKIKVGSMHSHLIGKTHYAGKDSNGNKLTWRKATKEEIKANPDNRILGRQIVAIGKDVLFFYNSIHAENFGFVRSGINSFCKEEYSKESKHGGTRFYKGYLWYYQDEVLIVEK